jgi:ribose transport system permease protein
VAAAVVAASIVVPLLACLALGFVSGVLTVWSRLPSFIITLAMMFIAEGVAKYLTKSVTFKMPELLSTVGNGGLTVLSLPTCSLRIPYNAMVAGAVLLLGHFVLQHTRFGRYVTMTGGNREATRLAGVRTGRIVVACLVLSALAAGVGGLLNAGRLGSASLDQNKDLLLGAVACVVLGGTSLFGGEGSMPKTLVGVLTFTVLNVGLMQVDWINDLARQLLTGIVLLVALVINGLLAKRR